MYAFMVPAAFLPTAAGHYYNRSSDVPGDWVMEGFMETYHPPLPLPHMKKYVVHLQSAGRDSKVQRRTAEDRLTVLQAQQILQ